MMHRERTTKLPCPACGALIVARGRLGEVGEDTDVGGNALICFTCRALAIYIGDPPTGLRAPTADEKEQLLRDPTIRSTLAVLMMRGPL